MKKNKRSNTVNMHPYSLVEMLVVMAIIAILAGLGAGGYKVGRRWVSQSKTEALLAKIKIALESYKNDKGYYPLPHNQSINFKLDTNAKDYKLYPDLVLTENHYQPRNNMNSFIDYSKIQHDQSYKFNYNDWNYYYIKDGWNAPLVNSVTLIGGSTEDKFGAIKYRCPGVVNKTSFDLYSSGPDRVFATDPAVDMEDDIYAQ